MLDSLIGYVAGVLSDPTAEDSFIGFAVGSLYDPTTYGDFLIGYASGTLTPPHHPIGTWNGATVVWSSIGTWNGTGVV